MNGLSVGCINFCQIVTNSVLANELTFAGGMNSEETKKEERVDTGKEVNPETELNQTEEATESALVDEGLDSEVDLVQLEKEKYLRLYSEFENFRRRTSKERLELLQTAGREVINTMLPVLDDFERALKANESLKDNNASVVEGFQLIYKKMFGSLEIMGLKPMKSIGETFDAELHEAVTKIQAPEDSLKGKIVDELEKGYYLNDKVIRFAKVVIGE